MRAVRTGYTRISLLSNTGRKFTLPVIARYRSGIYGRDRLRLWITR